MHPDDREAALTAVCTTLFEHGEARQEFRFRHADGRWGWTASRLRLIRDDTGRPIEVVGLWLDVTDRKEAEAEHRRLRAQLLEAQRMESVARLAGGAAHDFNNLLTVINGYSDLVLKRLSLADPLRESVLEIRKAGRRAARLSQQLLILGRKQIVQPAPVNLNDIVGEVGNTLDRLIGEDIRLQCQLNFSLGTVLADPGQIHQVLMNLAVNARDAMPNGGTLVIETNNVELDESYARGHVAVKPGPYAQLKVSDTGIGMSKEVLAHVFEPFYTTKAPGLGTGLGLATVYSIVRQSGGSITVHSELGHGAVFTVYLPRGEMAVAASAELAPPLEVTTSRGTETILVVEDDEQVRRIATTVLRDHGYKVIEAGEPTDALRQSEGYPGRIHLLLTDVIMPGMSGPELADRIRASRPVIEIIFMSAYSGSVMNERAILPASVPFLQKPFSPERLIHQVREVLGPPRALGRVLVVDDEESVRSFIKEVLRSAGYDVFEAQHGRDAVLMLRDTKVDLFITDLIMPEQEGIETVQILHRQYAQIKIIATSGRISSLLPAAQHLGADAVMVKPFTPDELLHTVEAVMRSAERDLGDCPTA